MVTRMQHSVGSASMAMAPITQHCEPSRRRVLQSAALALALQGGSAASAQRARADAASATTDAIGQQYDGYAATYDDLDGGLVADSLGFPELRARLLAQASGRVLEVGVGTGLNLQFYRREQLTSLTAVDLSRGMLRQAERRADAQGLLPGLLSFRQADVQALPFAPASFDAVVDTFSLCVFPDPLLALTNMAAVLRPGGRLLLLEHSRSRVGALAWYQDLTAATVAATSKGCVWNQDVLGLTRSAGLACDSVEEHLGGLVVSLVATREG